MHPTLDDVYDIYKVDPKDERDHVEYIHAGRVMIHNGALDVLADYHHLLGGLEDGPMTPRMEARWNALKRNPYFRVVSRQELRDGHHPDLLKVHESPSAGDGNGDDAEEAVTGVVNAQRPPSVFEFDMPGMTVPGTLEVKLGHHWLNGIAVSLEEVARILQLARSGQAVLRYKKQPKPVTVQNAIPNPIQKMEEKFEELAKIEPHLEDALGKLREAVKAGHVDEGVLKHLTREIFVDPMVEGVGNKKAYSDFLSRPKQGVHIRMDGNDFGSINKIHSFEHGNQAIIAMGRAMREAMDESVGKANGKLFRIGGDEFASHVPTYEHAARFMRTLREKLEAIPPIGGTHKLSVSAGFGHTPEDSDQASIEAKKAKKAQGYLVGSAKTHVYSGVPGLEGHVPVSPDQLPMQAPPDKAPEGFKMPAQPPGEAASSKQTS